MAPERKRTARDYEQALKRQELATGRALVQALPADGSPGPRELAAAKRVLTQALFELRRLGRDLDEQIEGLGSRQPGRARSAQGGRPAQGAQPRPARGAGPGELDRFEAARNAVEEVAERWEGRRDQLGAELDRRQPHRRQGQGPRQGGQARGVRNRGAAAPARPERPRSPRSRRSPG